ncbi:hypothetical protein DPMN_070588, partial [Dreissena polymorpha]
IPPRPSPSPSLKLSRDLIGTNVLTKSHECSHEETKTAPPPAAILFRVLTRKTSPSPGGHVYERTETIFEIVQDMIVTHVRTKFHEHWAIIVAS